MSRKTGSLTLATLIISVQMMKAFGQMPQKLHINDRMHEQVIHCIILFFKAKKTGNSLNAPYWGMAK